MHCRVKSTFLLAFINHIPPMTIHRQAQCLLYNNGSDRRLRASFRSQMACKCIFEHSMPFLQVLCGMRIILSQLFNLIEQYLKRF